MLRVILAVALALHGLAHANAGMLAANGPRVLPSVLWAVASVGFVAAGLGLLGLRPFAERWRSLTIAAAVSSVFLLIYFHPATRVPGVALDGALLLAATARPLEPRHLSGGRVARRLWHTVGIALVAYLAVVIVARPWHMRWGSTEAELRAGLPADELVPAPHYTVQHAVTIHASAEKVWPWLIQIGQDRGGFYSYEWLERLIGDEIRNADRIHPEWQERREGDLVRATQPNYLGGIFGRDLGWRVGMIERNRVLALDGWGAFVLEPLSDGRTRLIVRTRGAGEPNVALAPLGLLIFEPAHFIMQRKMLLGIKERAEGA